MPTLKYQISVQVAYSFAKFCILVLLLDSGSLLLLILAYFGNPALLTNTIDITIKLLVSGCLESGTIIGSWYSY